MVTLYGAEISELPDPLLLPEILQGLPQERQEKVLRAKQRQKRLQSLGAGLLLADVLKQYGISTETLRTEECGKPVAEGIHFNLSHSGNMVICAVGTGRVGCDIEQIRPVSKNLEARFFSDAEREQLAQFSEEAYLREFYRIWTKKESYLKMTGIGLRVSPDTLEIQDCYMKEYFVPGYQIMVCAEEVEFSSFMWKTIGNIR